MWRLRGRIARFDIDGVIAPSAVSKSFAEMINQRGPLSVLAIPSRFLCFSEMRAQYVKVVGQNHLAVTLVSDTGETVRAIAFRAEGEPLGAKFYENRAGASMSLGKSRLMTGVAAMPGQLQITDVA